MKDLRDLKDFDDTRCETYNLQATNKLQDGGIHFCKVTSNIFQKEG